MPARGGQAIAVHAIGEHEVLSAVELFIVMLS
jgi:hypothetical protein